MSMNGHFVEIRPRRLKRLQQEPSLAEVVVYLESSDTGLVSDDEAIELYLRHLSRAQQQHLRALMSADVDAIKAALKKVFPKKIWPVLMAHYSSMTKEQLAKEAAEKRKGLIETVRQMKSTLRSAAQERAGGRPTPDHDLGERLCIDKAWDGLDYLLCSATDTCRGPLDLAILGGVEIGKDLGYGPARYLDAGEVRAVAAALSAVTHGTLRYHYDAADMNELMCIRVAGMTGPTAIAWIGCCKRSKRFDASTRVSPIVETRPSSISAERSIVGCNRPSGRIAPIPHRLLDGASVQCAFGLLHPTILRLGC